MNVALFNEIMYWYIVVSQLIYWPAFITCMICIHIDDNRKKKLWD